MAIIPNHYMRSVLSIGVRINGDINWIGTGFLIIRELADNKYQPFMVTNKHVLEEQSSVVVRLKKKESDELLTIDVALVENGEKVFSVHPNPEVDVAVMLLIGPFFEKNHLELAAIDIDKQALTSSEFISEGGGEGT